jgi:hypothetical protein
LPYRNAGNLNPKYGGIDASTQKKAAMFPKITTLKRNGASSMAHRNDERAANCIVDGGTKNQTKGYR